MYIKKITIKNFKSFIEETIELQTPNGDSGSGLNIFVGENNAGKSNVFEAINFLRNGLPSGKGISDLKNKNTKKDDEMFVEIEFSGSVKELIENFSGKKLDDYIVDEGENQTIKTRRSDKNYKITQGKKEVEINIKKIGIWNFKTNQFENPSGLDADFKKLFEIDFIWADTNPEDIAKFGSTTICGKLLGEIVKSFETTDEYSNFSTAHQKAFNDPNSGLKKSLIETEKRTQKIFCDQFGSAEISFHFDQIEVSSFFKNTRIKIDDGIETYLDEKGSGMQRSVALALLQVYAESLIQSAENPAIHKPFYLFIDEPEICLHPQAQKKLLVALKKITEQKQIFITSHSPYFIDPDLIENVYRFENKVETGSKQFSCTDSATISGLKEKENRVFFFHHRDLFFTTELFFFEGVSDYERFSVYCENNDLAKIVQNFFFLAGKNDWKHFGKLCDDLKINAKFIFDLDVISKNSNTFTDNGLKTKIGNFGKELKQYEEKYTDEAGQEKTKMKVVKEKDQRCEPLFDESLSESEKSQKDEILEELKKQNILVLRYGMLENYLEENGDIVSDKKTEKEAELREIFSN